MTKQRFGGDWTEQKLSRIKEYILAYNKARSTSLLSGNTSTPSQGPAIER